MTRASACHAPTWHLVGLLACAALRAVPAAAQSVDVAIEPSRSTAGARAPDLRTFDRDIAQYFALLRTPGMAVGVARGDSLLYFKGLGYADVRTRTPITPNTIFWIASVTKTFTAVALKQLEAAGRVSLDGELARFPNKYFDARRIERGVTVGHVLSHTSESRPPGRLFVYNGGKYNLVFNVFDAVAPAEAGADVVRPFTRAIEEQILVPLRLDHTITRVASERFEALRRYVVTPYAYDDRERAYRPTTAPLGVATSYPATGMLSSVRDLVRYSHALATGALMSREAYADLTAPFYQGPDGPSPHGQGWFTTRFEGVELHWAFGYGDTDAALLLRVPARDLTLVMLSNAATPSAASLLGYGNPLNTPVVTAFLKSFVLQDRAPAAVVDYRGDLAAIERRLADLTAASGSRLYAEEALAYAMLLKLRPGSEPEEARAWGLLEAIDRRLPGFLDARRLEAFELLARFDEPAALRVGARLAAAYERSGAFHPVKAFYAARIHEARGDTAAAARLYGTVADRAAFLEQPVTHGALLALGRYYLRSDPRRAGRYLTALVQHKEMLGTRDDEYRAAMALRDSTTARRDGAAAPRRAPADRAGATEP